ncbi:alpha/beta fold hydrolase [Burkholderia lata]|uniref:alpha/beta fold hydrolase n=1 Tax=Burkholderia lata (strain ATCC 17760 / DSM 23089 / LMG 22485 / NCIMB 9086 / R18194 / 383) TaxID=482957 RepID=UPI0014547D15|nr:alpha/beta hydrolase [Burkholderia lata]VWB87759.1 alpha/beta hydrolase [Burkholderia lata]
MNDSHLTAPTRFVEVDGDRLAYRRWGNAGAGQPPLLFLQHFRGGLDNWDPLMTDGLAAGREVILYNFRGCASSTGTPRNRIEGMADDAAKFVRGLGLPTVDVVGFSLGGVVAQDLARLHPKLVRKVMLLGTGPRGAVPHEHPENFEVALNPVPTQEDFLFLFFGRSEAGIAAGKAFWERRHQRADQDSPSSPELMQSQIEAAQASYVPLNAEKPFAHLAEIRQPTLIVNGADDVMIPSINSWHMAQNIPNAQLIIYPDAGHGAQFQYPHRFLKHAIQFLEDSQAA